MATNADVEFAISQRLPEILRNMGILPPGYECEVHLRRGNKKKHRDAEFKKNWNPDEDSIRITFSQLEDEDDVEIEKPLASPTSAVPAEDRVGDLLRALDRAEGRPGYDFVSLKWFRDTALPREGHSWASDEAARYDVLQSAIDRELIRTKKVSNPRPPNYPVTAIYLNRSHPEVAGALGAQSVGLPGFRPVKIRGEALSSTVLHDRR